jgi:hypothetical protein
MSGSARARSAGRASTVTDEGERLSRLATGAVADDTVLLIDEGPAGSGADGSVTITRDASSSLAVDVDADGDGYVVVADALQRGWVAEVDGERADLVDADHAGVAVHVPSGRHAVTLRYSPPGQRAGLAISALAAVGLVVAWIWGERLLVRLRQRHIDATPQGPPTIDQPPSSEVSPP